MALGQRIREAREARGWEQSDLAGKVPGLTQQALSALERRDSSSSKFAGKIAEALGIDAGWLMDGSGTTSQQDESGTPTGVLAHPMSHADPTLQEVVTMQWEGRKMWGDFPKRFRLQAPDDALHPEEPMGQWLLFTTELTPGPRDFVLVRDASGEYHMREYRARPGGRFEAYALNAAYPSFDSVEHGLEVVAVYQGREPVRRGRG